MRCGLLIGNEKRFSGGGPSGGLTVFAVTQSRDMELSWIGFGWFRLRFFSQLGWIGLDWLRLGWSGHG